MQAWLVVLVALCLLPAARAGGLSVSPTLLRLLPGQSVQSVVLTNTSAQTVTVETQVQVWPSDAPDQWPNDVVISPPVVTLAPNQRARVRVGLARPGDGERERAYRLYFTELPAPAPLMGAGVGVRLRIGIPFFITPKTPQPQPLRWTLAEAGGQPVLRIHNDGNVHARLSQLVLAQENGPEQPLNTGRHHVLAGEVLSVALTQRPSAPWRLRWQDGDDVRDSGPLQP